MKLLIFTFYVRLLLCVAPEAFAQMTASLIIKEDESASSQPARKLEFDDRLPYPQKQSLLQFLRIIEKLLLEYPDTLHYSCQNASALRTVLLRAHPFVLENQRKRAVETAFPNTRFIVWNDPGTLLTRAQAECLAELWKLGPRPKESFGKEWFDKMPKAEALRILRLHRSFEAVYYRQLAVEYFSPDTWNSQETPASSEDTPFLERNIGMCLSLFPEGPPKDKILETLVNRVKFGTLSARMMTPAREDGDNGFTTRAVDTEPIFDQKTKRFVDSEKGLTLFFPEVWNLSRLSERKAFQLFDKWVETYLVYAVDMKKILPFLSENSRKALVRDMEVLTNSAKPGRDTAYQFTHHYPDREHSLDEVGDPIAPSAFAQLLTVSTALLNFRYMKARENLFNASDARLRLWRVITAPRPYELDNPDGSFKTSNSTTCNLERRSAVYGGQALSTTLRFMVLRSFLKGHGYMARAMFRQAFRIMGFDVAPVKPKREETWW